MQSAGGRGGRSARGRGKKPRPTPAADSVTTAEQPSDEPDDAHGHEALLQGASHAQGDSEEQDVLEQLPLAARLAEKQQQQQQADMLADAAPSVRPPSGLPNVAMPSHPPPASGK